MMAILAATAALSWTMPDGKVVKYVRNPSANSEASS